MAREKDELDRALEEAGFEILTEDEDEFRDGEWLVMLDGQGPAGRRGKARGEQPEDERG